MKKYIIIFILILSIVACKKESVSSGKIILMSTVNPNLTFITAMAYLYPKRYGVKVARSPMEMASAAVKNKADILFHTLVGSVRLYKKATKNYYLYKAYILKAVQLVSTKPVNKANDLNGKTIYIMYKNGTPSILFNKIVKQYNVKPAAVKYAKPAVISKLFIAGKIDYAFIPEFWVSQIALAYKKKLYIKDVEDFIKGDLPNIPVAAIIIRKDSTVNVQQLHKDVQTTIDYINNKTDDFAKHIAAIYKQRYKISVNPEVLKQAIQSKRLVYTFVPDEITKKTLINIFGVEKSVYEQFTKH